VVVVWVVVVLEPSGLGVVVVLVTEFDEEGGVLMVTCGADGALSWMTVVCSVGVTTSVGGGLFVHPAKTPATAIANPEILKVFFMCISRKQVFHLGVECRRMFRKTRTWRADRLGTIGSQGTFHY
jgi:hypothetical protein